MKASSRGFAALPQPSAVRLCLTEASLFASGRLCLRELPERHSLANKIRRVRLRKGNAFPLGSAAKPLMCSNLPMTPLRFPLFHKCPHALMRVLGFHQLVQIEILYLIQS